MTQRNLLITSLIAIMLVMGFVVWRKSQMTFLSQPTPSVQETPLQISAESIDTSDWKTYRNEEYGFEFKIPDSWTIERTTTSAVFYLKSDNFTPVLLGYTAKHESDYSSGEILVWISMNNKNLSIRDRYLQYDDAPRSYFTVDEIPRQDIKINNYDAVVFDNYVEKNSNWSHATNHKVVILKIKNKILHFDYLSQGKSDPQIEYILKEVVATVSDI